MMKMMMMMGLMMMKMMMMLMMLTMRKRQMLQTRTSQISMICLSRYVGNDLITYFYSSYI
jgi:hypothetical protein